MFTILSSASLASDAPNPGNPEFSLRLGVLGAALVPVGESGELWNWFPGAGLEVDLAVPIPRVHLNALFLSGRMSHKTRENLEVLTAMQHLSPVFRAYSHPTGIVLDLQAGVANTMIQIGSGAGRVLAVTENEFGVSGGIRPSLRRRRFYLTAPLLVHITLSAPRQLQMVSIGIGAGGIF